MKTDWPIENAPPPASPKFKSRTLMAQDKSTGDLSPLVHASNRWKIRWNGATEAPLHQGSELFLWQGGQSCMVTGTPCHQVWLRALLLAGRSVMHGDWNRLSSGVVQSSSSSREVSHAQWLEPCIIRCGSELFLWQVGQPCTVTGTPCHQVELLSLIHISEPTRRA